MAQNSCLRRREDQAVSEVCMGLPERLFVYVLQPFENRAAASSSIALVCLCQEHHLSHANSTAVLSICQESRLEESSKVTQSQPVPSHQPHHTDHPQNEWSGFSSY